MAPFDKRKEPIGLHDNPQTGLTRPIGIAPLTEQKGESSHPVAGLWSKRNLRERTMIVALLIIIAVGGVGYFAALPALETIASLEGEIATFSQQKSELQAQIAQGDMYRDQLSEATDDFNDYRVFFYRPMRTEDIDRLITGMIVESGMTPLQLDISPGVSEALSMHASVGSGSAAFAGSSTASGAATNTSGATDASGGTTASPGASGAAGSVATSGAAAGTEGVNGGATTTATDALLEATTSSSTTPTDAGGASAGASQTAQEPTDVQSALSVSVCALAIRAEGERSNLFDFLARSRDIVAIEVVSYSWTDPTIGSSLTSALATKGEVTLQVKIYFLPAYPALDRDT